MIKSGHTLQSTDVLIVGSGHAGVHAAAELRRLKFDGAITVLGEERSLPYERPPLTKDYMTGQKSFERILLRPPSFWLEHDISLVRERQVVAVNADSREAHLADGATIEYGRLIWAAGGRARKLACPGDVLLGIHTLRSRDDVDRIVESLPSVTEVVIVGGGYVGLEAAASLIKQKKSVTVVEAHDRVLSRVAGPLLSQFFEDQHRAQGVNVKLGQTVTALDGKNGMVCGVRLASGERVPAQLVIVGIGIEPSVEPLLAAGAEGGDGVRVDGRCRTSLDNVYAIGDCALHANIFADGREIRLESVQNAQDMATTAARDIVGEALRESVAPWFWSFQYDLRLQSVGLSAGHDSTLTRGSLENRQFSIVYLKAGHVVALDCVNATRDFIDGRAWVQNRVCETMVNGAQACK